jgi:hypothetical protein
MINREELRKLNPVKTLVYGGLILFAVFLPLVMLEILSPPWLIKIGEAYIYVMLIGVVLQLAIRRL